MRFKKKYEIREYNHPMSDDKYNKLELVKWDDRTGETCFVLCLFQWNGEDWNINPVGTRIFEYSIPGLNEYIMSVLNMYRTCYELEDEDE